MKPIIKIKRVYDKPLKKDGCRILADRLWPRGLKTEDAQVDDWAKLLAPTTSLRTWYGHDPELWSEFQRKYRLELRRNKHVPDFIEKHADKKLITLLYAAKDSEHTHAIVLQYFLEKQFEAYYGEAHYQV